MAKPDFSPSRALYVLEQAIDDRKITRADLDRYTRKIRDEISELEERLRSLRNAAVAPVKRVLGRRRGRPHGAAKVAAKAVRRAKKAVSAEVAASRKLQGQYIAAIRQVPKTQRAKYAAIAKEKGREAAIREIKKANR